MEPHFQASVRRGCAAVVCATAAFGALAQSAPPQAVLERAQATGVVAGLQRAVSTPLEVVWLRAAAEFEAWNGEGLAGATVGRTGWRYIFGGAAQFAPAPNELARLVVSSLSLPKAPVSAGPLDVAGRGRLFVISPEAPGRALSGQVALVLAAGSTLEVSDTAAPGLQIEVKAPEHRPLLLGNLASASVRRMLAHLVKPHAVSASSASLENGRVALRRDGEIELAAILDGRTPPVEPRVAVAATAEPAPIKPELRAHTPIAIATVEPVISAPIEAAPAEIAPVDAAPAKPAPVEVAAIQPEPLSAPIGPPEAVSPTIEVPAPVAIAAVPAKPVIAIIEVSPPPAKTPQQAASIDRMRAEIEAEIARDRERLAQQREHAAPAKRFAFGV